MTAIKQCVVSRCREPEFLQGWCFDHAIVHADELVLPTPEELTAADTESMDALVEKIRAESDEAPGTRDSGDSDVTTPQQREREES